jgi:hypothetical protein
MKDLLHTRAVKLTCQFGKELQLDLHAVYPDEDRARKAAKALLAGRDRYVANLPELGEVLAERFAMAGGPRLAGEVLRFFEQAEPHVKTLAAVPQGKALSVSLRVPGRGAEWAVLALCTPVMTVTPIDDPRDLPPEWRNRKEVQEWQKFKEPGPP